ncbi:aldehyde dehydrogenase (NADP(+)) [Nocardioides endophyticus]|uniref:Aldehyde dehydrogenase (NADP(+)) n=1 Tax=Nocardioides endophyticus TaxID=1353775 RepID=A0ABP8Z9N6_9ACTN
MTTKTTGADSTATDPRTGDPLTGVAATSVDEAEALISAAAAASSDWAALPRPKRARLLRRVADGLEAKGAAIVAAADTETALGPARLENELRRTTGQLRMFAAEIESGHYLQALVTEADPTAGVPDLRRMRFPRGPVVVFAASNFPLAFSVAGGDTASALAAGCPVVVKAHENHPVTAELVAEVLRRELPDDVFALCHGREAGTALLEHPATTAVGFTGSLQGGVALARICRDRPVPIPFFGELSSLNPVVVMEDAATAYGLRIAQEFAASLTLGNGQFCTKPGLLFVPADGPMRELVADAIGASTTGVLLTASMREHYLDHPGHERLPLLARGQSDPGSPLSVSPEVRFVDSASYDEALPLLIAERFGPAGVVITYTSQADLIAMLKRLPGNLTGSVHSTVGSPDADPKTDLAAAAQVRAVAEVLSKCSGRLIHNGWPTGVAVTLAQHHGGPFPATTDAATTSVGVTAIERWLIPVAYQDWPDSLLPPELQRANPLGVPRREA